MTTSVDILFKELPLQSRADERISRPDTSLIGSRADERRPEVSKDEGGKSFADHLDQNERPNVRENASNEAPVRNERAESKSQDDFGRELPREERNVVENKNTASDNSGNNVETVEKPDASDTTVNEPKKVASSENAAEKPAEQAIENAAPQSNVVQAQNAPEPKAPGLSTKDLIAPEKTPEIAAMTGSDVAAVKANLENSVVVGKPVEQAKQQTPVQLFTNGEQQGNGQNAKNGQNQPQGLQVAAAVNSENAKQNSPQFATENTASNTPQSALNQAAPEVPQNVMIDGDVDQNNPLAKDTKNPLLSATYANEPVANNANQNGQGLSEKVAEILAQSNVGKPAASEPISEPQKPEIPSEVGNSISAMAMAMKEQVSNAPVMNVPEQAPQTVDIESTKTLPFAVTQSPNNAGKPSSNGKKSGPAIAATKATNPSAANNAAAAAMQNSASQSALLNAQKSDIQIDLGLSGQKFDAPLGQAAGQAAGSSSLPGNSMLAAQDVNFQKALSSVSNASKPELPMSARMVNEQITVAINKNIVKGLNNFRIQLHPAELGQVDIKLEIAADGKMQAAMMVENEKTLSMLQRDQGVLEKALQDAGINLSNKNLSFSLMKQNQENGARHFANMTQQSSNDDLDMDEFMDMASVQEMRMAYSNKALDISV